MKKKHYTQQQSEKKLQKVALEKIINSDDFSIPTFLKGIKNSGTKLGMRREGFGITRFILLLLLSLSSLQTHFCFSFPPPFVKCHLQLNDNDRRHSDTVRPSPSSSSSSSSSSNPHPKNGFCVGIKHQLLFTPPS